jgi:hypothetical protein
MLAESVRFLVLAAIAVLLPACAVTPSQEETGRNAVDADKSPRRYALDHALAHPIFAQYYSCAEHPEGELPYLGDALGADCVIQKLDEIDGLTFARMYKGDGSANEDWYGWRQDVLSPCDGEVVKVTVNATTNQPGVLGEPPATFVVVKRDDGVHFLLAHLDNLTVEVGDRVTAGQRLGLVGNNGYARTPHVHIGAWHDETPLQVRFDLSASSDG